MDGIEDVKQSFGRCIAAGDLIERFYEIFLRSNPEIAPHFVNTDFTVQKGLLRRGINLAIMFAGDQPVGVDGINRLRTSHAKLAMDISPNLYKYWKESLIQAISEFDPKFDAQLRSSWDYTLQKTIDHIVAGYYE